MNCTATHAVTQADLDAGHLPTRPVWTMVQVVHPQTCDARGCTWEQESAAEHHEGGQETSYATVGDVIHYTIVAKNTGNTTLAAVTVTDPQVSNLVCTPANGSALAPGASMNCTATHEVTQADIDAGHYANTACVDDGAGGAPQTCDAKDVPGSKNPLLSITKVAQEASYAAVGDIIHYTIVAKNTGNTTLAAVTVTDPQVSNLVCTPANGSALAPGASMNCTATHEVTQADIDAGHYANTACVDDGAGGAPQTCDAKDVPGSKNPLLSITKVAQEASYAAVGDIIHYTIVAKNTGNTTLAAVTVTDPQVSNLVCTPANGSALAPGASMNCTATHEVTQADIDAGHYANTACVDDGAGGAPQTCDAKDVPGSKNPLLSITKVAQETSYAAVGDIIHYTIVAKNTGNTTLAAVTVTDPQVSNLVCTPANGSALAPGASMNCTATHEVTQADIDAGHYANTACVDDGAGGAGQVLQHQGRTGERPTKRCCDEDS